LDYWVIGLNFIGLIGGQEGTLRWVLLIFLNLGISHFFFSKFFGFFQFLDFYYYQIT